MTLSACACVGPRPGKTKCPCRLRSEGETHFYTIPTDGEVKFVQGELKAAINEYRGRLHALRSWLEDACFENGNYLCQCSKCELYFNGHKRRLVCKLCASKKEDVMEMRLCEQGHVILKPDQLYRFTVDPHCPKCVHLEQMGKQ